MVVEDIDTLVVGAGQAGIAMSEHLGAAHVPHLVLERHRIAERWRTERWDGLVANGPAWHDRFPNMEYPGIDPDAFPSKDQVADYFVAYADMIKAPIRCGVEVREVRARDDGPGFRVETSAGTFRAHNVVAATGPFQRPLVPALVPSDAGLLQIHSNAYRNPRQLPAGGVLVVGSGSSGCQIADELCRAGREVFLSVGPHDRPPRRYRGYDYCWWLGVMGKWDIETPGPGTEHVTIAVSGAYGGATVDFRRLAARGITLLGRAIAFEGGTLRFAPDLAENIARGDANYLSVLEEADAFAARNRLDLPPDPEARRFDPDPASLSKPILALDLRRAGIGSIIWATGYRLDFNWLKVDTFDETGRPRHRRGVSPVPGLYFVGLPWLTRRGSSFIWGAWADAKQLADHIATHRRYRLYRPGARLA